MTTTAEQACYTLINAPTDAEPPSEMQLRQDLGKYLSDYLPCFEQTGGIGHSGNWFLLASSMIT